MNSMFQSPIWGFNAANSFGNLLGTKLANLDFTSPTDIAGNPAIKPANDMYSHARRGFPTMNSISGNPMQQPNVVVGANGVPTSSVNAQDAFSNAQRFFTSSTADNFTYPKDLAKTFEGANGVGVADPSVTGSSFNAGGNQYGNFLQDPSNAQLNIQPQLSMGNGAFNPVGNTYSNYLQDPTNSIGFNKTPNPAGDSFNNLFGLTDWLNGGTAKGDTNYMSSGDILGGIGSLASGAMGAYGMFTSLDQGQQQLDDASRRTDLLESKYNEELRHRSAIRDQNRAG